MVSDRENVRGPRPDARFQGLGSFPEERHLQWEFLSFPNSKKPGGVSTCHKSTSQRTLIPFCPVLRCGQATRPLSRCGRRAGREGAEPAALTSQDRAKELASLAFRWGHLTVALPSPETFQLLPQIPLTLLVALRTSLRGHSLLTVSHWYVSSGLRAVLQSTPCGPLVREPLSPLLFSPPRVFSSNTLPPLASNRTTSKTLTQCLPPPLVFLDSSPTSRKIFDPGRTSTHQLCLFRLPASGRPTDSKVQLYNS